MNRIERMTEKHRHGLVAGDALGDMRQLAGQIQSDITDGNAESAVRNLRRLARLMIGDDAEIVRAGDNLILCPRCRLERKRQGSPLAMPSIFADGPPKFLMGDFKS